MRTLVAVSGGLDSTYVLWRLLSTTDDEVTALFFDHQYITTAPDRNLPQQVSAVFYYGACMSVVDWLSTNIRAVKLVTKIVKDTDINEVEAEEVRIAHQLACMVRDEYYDRAVLCIGGEGEPGLHKPMTTPAQQKIFMHITGEKNPSKLWYPLGYSNWNKYTAHQIAELPAELQALSVSCQNPWVDTLGDRVDCGECIKCVRNKQIKSNLSAGNTPKEAWSKWRNSEIYLNQKVMRLKNIGLLKSKDTLGLYDHINEDGTFKA